VKIISDITIPHNLNRPVITIGTFDGIHIGHRLILKRVVDEAIAGSFHSAVVTFYPHPRIVLGQEVKLLNTRDEKRSIIESLGIDYLIEIPFTIAFSDIKAEEFIKMLVDLINPSMIIIGYDHGFGRNREGDINVLEALAVTYGFKVVNIPAVEERENKVSSSYIRSLITKGAVKEAGRLLGEPYSLTGTVVRGNQIGRRLGYPTANIYVEDDHKLIPAMGVYASIVEYNGKEYFSMTNVGFRPTLDVHKFTIEANIFDFDKEIYYEKLTLKLIDRLRDEKRFNDLDALKDQLKIDMADTLRVLNK
jgi:riboflavin kinase/FMN adenylyltransferase